ncbi:MAG: PAS domain S-box protein [Rhodopirellula sp.]|nr:PAS domain S-box protein [Rhodopirellula sp.]
MEDRALTYRRDRFFEACADRVSRGGAVCPRCQSSRCDCGDAKTAISGETDEWLYFESIRRFQAMVEHTPAGIYLTDADGQCTYVNRRWCEMAGMAAEEAMGSGWKAAIHPEDRERVAQCWYAEVESRAMWNLEYRMRSPAGKTTWVHGQASPLLGVDGGVRGFQGINFDITWRKRVENRLQRLLESAPDAMIIVNREGTIVLANAQAESMFAWTRQELIGQPIETLVPESFRQGHAQRRAEYAANPAARSMAQRTNLLARRKNGEEFPAEISLSPIETDGEVLVAAAVRDISSRKRLEQTLQLNLQVQATLTALLELALEPIPLREQLERALDLLFAVEWIELESKGAIFFVDGATDVLVMAAQRGLSDPVLTSCANVPFGRCLCGRAAASRQIVFVSSVDPLHEIQYAGMHPHGHYCVPIMSGDDLLGVMTLYVKEGHRNSAEEEGFLAAVASALAGIIKHSRTEASLRESEVRFELAVRGSAAGLWDWDLRTNQVHYSPRWKSMLGYEPEEIQDDYLEWESRLHPADRQRALATISDYLEGKTSEYELEHRLRHKDGTYRWIIARGAVLRDENGSPYRMAGSHIDVTERRRSEERLRHREAQLLAAQKIQQHLLPQEPPATPGFNIAGKVIPAEFAGGDYFDYLWLPDGALGIVVGDVSGHDVSAALLTASTSAHLRSFGEDHVSVEEILMHTNSILSREIGEGQFVTLVFIRLDLATAMLSYASAGHPSAYVLNQTGDVKAVLDSTSLPLAIQPKASFPVRGPVCLEPGDVVLLVTDGVQEAQSQDGDYFGTDRMLEVVRKNLHREAEAIVRELQDAVSRFSGRAEPQDDVTVVVVRVQPRTSGSPA